MSDMQVTCPTCRGAKEMLKLGGMVGKCNRCHGVGQIKHSDLPVMQVIVPAENVTELVSKVGEAIPWTKSEVQKPEPIEDTIKVDRKKAIYKRKTA